MIADLHSHILPAIDDGARDMEASLTLLRLQRAAGVEHLALTPHYRCDDQPLDEFLDKRNEAYGLLCNAMAESGIELDMRLGAEVYFSPMLPELDLKKLCMEGTDCLLVELPVTYTSSWTFDILYELQLQGVQPIIAHVERYPYIVENPAMLTTLVQSGCIIQLNATSLIRGDARARMALRLIKWGLAHVIASDTHSTRKRPPQMQEAASVVSEKLGASCWERLNQNAQLLFQGEELLLEEQPHTPRKLFGIWV